MNINNLDISGCYELISISQKDKRGTFVKIFHDGMFSKLGLEKNYREEYYSISKKNVLRGMHFQTPPHDHIKLVHCIVGTIFDAVVDLRGNSPTFKKSLTIELSEEKGNMLYIPSGVAHGFYVKSKTAIVLYKVSTVYSKEHDSGILWNSTDISWPNNKPIVSERDRSFPELTKYETPFI